jgi:hypothetical protein
MPCEPSSEEGGGGGRRCRQWRPTCYLQNHSRPSPPRLFQSFRPPPPSLRAPWPFPGPQTARKRGRELQRLESMEHFPRCCVMNRCMPRPCLAGELAEESTAVMLSPFLARNTAFLPSPTQSNAVDMRCQEEVRGQTMIGGMAKGMCCADGVQVSPSARHRTLPELLIWGEDSLRNTLGSVPYANSSSP